MLGGYDSIELLFGKENPSSFDGVAFVSDISRFRRILAVGDIHGEYQRMRSLFDAMDYRPEEDLLVFLGDYIDRGAESLRCLAEVKSISETYQNVITLRGNHESLLLDHFVEHGIEDIIAKEGIWLENGGDDTLYQLRRLYEKSPAEFESMLGFVKGLKRIAVVGREFIFTHAGFLKKPYLKQKEEMLWVRRDFYNGYAGKQTVAVGHTPVQRLRAESDGTPILQKNHIWLCDTGSFRYDGHISCVDVKTGEFWQSEDKME
ncbi:MAG: metallophosphoesterase [Schwartzia sp.]|nr:metallophosphoesterase [Schwartzia sp. (in: firmicutes)]